MSNASSSQQQQQNPLAGMPDIQPPGLPSVIEVQPVVAVSVDIQARNKYAKKFSLPTPIPIEQLEEVEVLVPETLFSAYV